MKNKLLWVLDAVLLLTLLGVPFVWLIPVKYLAGISPQLFWRPWLLAVPVVVFLIRLVVKAQATRRGVVLRGWAETALFKKLCLLITMPTLFFLGIEQVFELAGYESHLPPVVIRGAEPGGADDEGSPGLVQSDEFRWRFVPGVMWRGRKVNQLGFLDREVNPQKMPGTIRVICMGDSITAQGIPPYSGRLHERLQSHPPTDDAWEAFNMAVHGYSSVIGLRLFERRGKMLAPDVVTLYFGWNDHWQGGRMPDRVRLGVTMTRGQALMYDILKNKRFGQWFLARTPAEDLRAASREGGYLRVPQEEYVKTLRDYVALIREAGAVPLLITAPRTERPSDMLVQRGNAVSVEEIIRLHDEYVGLTRQVARETGAHLLDLAAMFETLDRSVLMQKDGIHMTGEGLDVIAGLLHEKLVDLVRDPAWRTARAL